MVDNEEFFENNILKSPKNYKRGQTKTSKPTLNQNAIKFRLKNLSTEEMRYDNIYKNLLRDIRKVFTLMFNSEMHYLKLKHQNQSTDYQLIIKQFIE